MQSLESLELEKDTLGKLASLLHFGKIAYDDYLSNGKKFAYAKIIKENNLKLLHFILSSSHHVSAQRGELLRIAYHLQAWLLQWKDLHDKAKPDLEDTFVFATIVRFPKESLTAINKYSEEKFNISFT